MIVTVPSKMLCRTVVLVSILFVFITLDYANSKTHKRHYDKYSEEENSDEYCYCTKKGTCSSSSSSEEGSGDIDIRIVTPGSDDSSSSACPHGQEQCCGCGIRDDKGCRHPWLAALLVGSELKYIGGGVLLAPDVIMTAAHKVKKRSASHVTVRLGAWDLEANSVIDVTVSSIWIHPDFDKKTLKNDVAILKLSEAVTLSSNINTACLPKSDQSFKNQKCYVAGWGKDAFGSSGSLQTVAKEVDVTVVGKHYCQESLRSTRLGKSFKLDDSFLCAGGEKNKDACTGDGGSPLICEQDGRWFVAGLVAWGIGCGKNGIPGVYVNIPHFVSWVEDKMH